MNHFLIPNSLSKSSEVTSLGVHAMELLINEIMKLGGNRRRLKAKLFGGASVVSNTGSRWTVGARNIEFAESFLRTENIELIGSHTGGQSGMHVYFNPHTTKAIVRLLDSATSTAVSDEQYRSSEAAVRHAQDRSADVTLF